MSFMKRFDSKLKSFRKDPLSAFLSFLMIFATLITALTVIGLVGDILVKGIPNLSPQLFSWQYTSENVSLLPALINTIVMAVIALIVAVPIAIGASLYLTEYTNKDNLLVKAIGLATETLSGIPSIIYGLFGALFFVKYAQLGLSLLSGAITLSIMILPLIMRTTEEALLSVPMSYSEGSFALGVGRLRTIFRIVLPNALPGIFAGIILSVGRIIGESAALIFTAGTVAEVASGVFSSSRTLAVHMYVISGEGFYIKQTYATAVVLVGLVIILNLLSGLVISKIGRKLNGEK